MDLNKNIDEYLYNGGSYNPDFGHESLFPKPQGWMPLMNHIVDRKPVDEKIDRGLLVLKTHKAICEEVNNSKFHQKINKNSKLFK